MGDHRVRGSDVSPQFDDRRFLHRGDSKAIARFDHRQSVHRCQLPEQQIATLHPLRQPTFGDCMLLLRHDIAQGQSRSGIARHHFEERKRSGQERFKIAPEKRVEVTPFARQICCGGDHVVQRLIHNLGGEGIGRPAMEEPWHEQLHERSIGIEFETVIAHELIPSLTYRQRAVDFSDKTQHFGRITIEKCTQPAPGKVGGRGSLDRSRVETAVLVFPAAAARAGIVTANFHLPVSRIAIMDYGDLELNATDSCCCSVLGTAHTWHNRGLLYRARREPHAAQACIGVLRKQ